MSNKKTNSVETLSDIEFDSTQPNAQLIVIEGPPHCGKTEIAQKICIAIKGMGFNCSVMPRFSDPIYEKLGSKLKRHGAHYLNVMMLDMCKQADLIKQKLLVNEYVIVTDWISTIDAHRWIHDINNFNGELYKTLIKKIPETNIKIKIMANFLTCKTGFRRGMVLERISAQQNVHGYYQNQFGFGWREYTNDDDKGELVLLTRILGNIFTDDFEVEIKRTLDTNKELIEKIKKPEKTNKRKDDSDDEYNKKKKKTSKKKK